MQHMDELGSRENHELTKTTARVRVLIDGLKPLVKTSIIEYESGEESIITLDYERLELTSPLSQVLLTLPLKQQLPTKDGASGTTRPSQLQPKTDKSSPQQVSY